MLGVCCAFIYTVLPTKLRTMESDDLPNLRHMELPDQQSRN